MILRSCMLVVLWMVYFTKSHQIKVNKNNSESSNPIVIKQTKDPTKRYISIVGDEFILDGNPLQIVSGSLHYFRLPAEFWRDRLQKLKALGFNAVSTYVEWSYHEPEERQYQFTGDRDVARFVRIAAEEGLLVLLRPGPYICAERDLGGFPYWLLSKYPNIQLRTPNKDYMYETRKWMSKIFQQMTPLLYGNGGPIILVQVENEYGSYGNDTKYKVQLRDIIKEHVGTNALLYTTDGTSLSMIEGGAVPETLTTMDFGVGEDVKKVFQPLRQVMPKGPLMNSEFYTGWLTHWGENWQRVDTDLFVSSLKNLLDNKINLNIYMFYGGSNFEMSSGANTASEPYYQPDITTYDYDAPLTEAGDPTRKYYAIRKLMEKYNPDVKNIPIPTPAPKRAYGTVLVHTLINLLSRDGRRSLGYQYDNVLGSKLPTFEMLRQRTGMVLYETALGPGEGQLQIHGPRDSVYVYVDKEFQGVINRAGGRNKVDLKSNYDSILSLLVENQGRVAYGPELHDFKGIMGEVKYNQTVLSGNWSIVGYPLQDVEVDDPRWFQPDMKHGPVLFRGVLVINEEPEDTYIDPTGWTKGYIWVNGHNLGRYWPVKGPQVTLYVPKVWLQTGCNEITIIELEKQASDLSVTFLNHPILNGYQ